MSYLQHLKKEAKDYDVPYPIFRDMDRIMDGVMTMTHLLDNTQMIKVLKDHGWDTEKLKPNLVGRDHLRTMVMRVMFFEVCENALIPDKYTFNYIEFWNNI
jgi:hypothetical protein